MFHRPWLVAPLVLALFAATVIVVPHANAQTANSHAIFRQWLTATNNGDLNGAAQYLAADFSVTLADGSQVTGQTAGEQAIMALGTPITVVSLTATSNHELDTQLQFAGGATTSVVITGDSGTIKSIAVSAASGSQATTPVAMATSTGS